jgi:hypothetical protein
MTMDNPSQQANMPENMEGESKNLKYLSILFIVFGISQILAGLINLLTLSPRFSNVGLADGILSVVYGVLMIVCSKILINRKALVIWLFSTIILLSIVFDFSVGRGVNYGMAIFGAAVIWSLFKLKEQGEIS